MINLPQLKLQAALQIKNLQPVYEAEKTSNWSQRVDTENSCNNILALINI